MFRHPLLFSSSFRALIRTGGFYTAETYVSAQPTDVQRADWRVLVNRILLVDSGSCDNVPIPGSSIESIYAVRSFQGYCVLYEITSTAGTYDKG